VVRIGLHFQKARYQIVREDQIGVFGKRTENEFNVDSSRVVRQSESEQVEAFHECIDPSSLTQLLAG
jgi:hypothetical protein